MIQIADIEYSQHNLDECGESYKHVVSVLGSVQSVPGWTSKAAMLATMEYVTRGVDIDAMQADVDKAMEFFYAQEFAKVDDDYDAMRGIN